MRASTLLLGLLGFVLATAVLGLGGAAAAPDYSEALDQYTLGRAKVDLMESAKAEGISAETAEMLLQIDAYATSSDTGCPNVDVDVINATERTVWNIEVVIEQKDGTETRTDKLHLPYLTSNTKSRVTVSCISDYSSRSRYGRNPISVSYIANGSKTLDEALPLMVGQLKNYSVTGQTVKPTSPGGDNLIADALSLDDQDVAHELILAIARTGVGKKELGDALALRGDGAIADAVAASMKKLPAAQQAQLARTLLASRAAERWQDQLAPMIEKQLCKGARADVLALWLQAQGDDGIPVAAYRDRIREKCTVSKSDGPALVAALEKDPSRAGPALDAADPALFASVLAGWRARKDKDLIPTGLGAYVRNGQIIERFDQATAIIPASNLPAALGAVVQSPAGAAVAHKAAWVKTAITRVEATEVPLVVASLTNLLSEGSIRSPEMVTAMKAVAAAAPDTAASVMATAASKTSVVFDAQKLVAAGIDISEFLAFNASLGDCKTVQGLAECADKIAAYKALAKVSQAAVKPEFVVEMRETIGPIREPAGLIDLATKLSAAGFDTGFVADRACRDARDAVRYDSDPEPALETVKKIAPNAACIEETRDEIAGKHRKTVAFSIFAIMGLILPLPAGGLMLRRRWRKLQKQLPADAVDEVATGAKLADRLGAGGLGRGLLDGIAEARRELAGTAVGRALERVDASVVDAARSTVSSAVKLGDAATLLVKQPGSDTAVYVVALPVRHARPQVVQRYLSAAWPHHLAAIQRAAGMPVLALVVMCGPDVAEATLVVGHHDGTTASDPDALLDARDARDRGANRFRHVMTLATTAAPTAKAA